MTVMLWPKSQLQPITQVVVGETHHEELGRSSPSAFLRYGVTMAEIRPVTEKIVRLAGKKAPRVSRAKVAATG